jgi:subtilisin family serine protease
MKHRITGPLEFLVVSIAGIALFAAACTSGGGGGGGPKPTPTPLGLAGCNSGATSIGIAAESLTFTRRMLERGPHPKYIPGRVAVKFSGTGTEPEIGLAMTRLRATQVAPRGDSGYVVYSIPTTQRPEAAAAALVSTRGIAEAKPLEARYIQVIPNNTDFGNPPPYVGPLVTPATQWDMYYTQMPNAWNITEGLPSVLIAVIDTGYDANNLNICQKVAGSVVFDLGSGAQDMTATAQDTIGHGSDVSGIAASSTNNGRTFAGVGWMTELLEVRVFPNATLADPNPAGASNLDVAAGINWAVAHGAKVINMSLGALAPCDAPEGNAINAAVAANVTVVVASGNDGSSTGIASPANCPNAISVGASAINDYSNAAHMASPTEYVASYSDFGGGGPTLVAPGGDAQASQLTCNVGTTCDYLQWILNSYSTTACCSTSSPQNFPGAGVLITGTSMAAPHVAGVASLMYAKTPSIQPATIKMIFSDQALGTDDICTNCAAEGNGRLNAQKALTHA